MVLLTFFTLVFCERHAIWLVLEAHASADAALRD
jgi:hypothetical protein